MRSIFHSGLNIKASSAAVERVFSRGGIIMRPHIYSISDKLLSNLSLCIAIVNLTLIYFQDYRLEFLVINIFGDFIYCIKMMIIMSLNRFSLVC